MAELFGFSFKKQQEKSRAPSPIQPSSDDGYDELYCRRLLRSVSRPRR